MSRNPDGVQEARLDLDVETNRTQPNGEMAMNTDPNAATDLHVYYDGGDYVIATSSEDAVIVWEEFSGGQHESRTDPELAFALMPDDRAFRASMTENMSDARTQTMREWAAELGRCWFCSENY